MTTSANRIHTHAGTPPELGSPEASPATKELSGDGVGGTTTAVVGDSDGSDGELVVASVSLGSLGAGSDVVAAGVDAVGAGSVVVAGGELVVAGGVEDSVRVLVGLAGVREGNDAVGNATDGDGVSAGAVGSATDGDACERRLSAADATSDALLLAASASEPSPLHAVRPATTSVSGSASHACL